MKKLCNISKTGGILVNQIETCINRLKDFLSLNKKRFLLGITGGPGAGKSSFAAFLVGELNRIKNEEIAVAVPMDGFHLPNEVLYAKNLYSLKGKPETFDAERFVSIVKKIHDEPYNSIYCPAYDRPRHCPVEDKVCVKPNHRIVIIEGNYLLLQQKPWNSLDNLFEEVWYLECSDNIMIERLIKRDIAGGKTKEEALRKILNTDIPNKILIESTKALADVLISV
jgi:pantothenate kinase